MLLLLMPLGRVLTLPLAGGAVSFAGQPAGFSLTASFNYGGLVETGNAATLKWGHRLSGASSSFTFTGEPTAFGLSGALGSGSFTFTGEPTAFGLSGALGSGSFTFTGEDVRLLVGSTFPPAATAIFLWRSQGLGIMVSPPARAIFYWKA